MADKVDKILVEVLQGTPPAGGCNCSGCSSSSSCGSASDWEKEVKDLAEELGTSYGDKVEVKFVDVDKEGLGSYPLMSKVLQMGYPYPITLINGEPKFAGGIMSDEIKTSIDEMMA